MRILNTVLLVACSVSVSSVPDDIEEFTLSNGILVVTRTIPDGEVEGLSFFLNGGSRFLSEETQGLEAFALECSMMGSIGFPGHMWRELMDATMAEWTGSYNYDYSRYHLRCLREDLPELSLRFVDCLLDPELEPQAVDQVRESMLSAVLQELDDPDKQVWLVANRVFMGDHPYRLRPDGTVETLASFSEDDIREFMSGRIQSGNILITHAGPTTAAALETILEGSFGRIPDGFTELPEVPPFGFSSDSLSVEHDEVLTAFAVVKFNAPPAGHPDQPAFRIGMRMIDEQLWQVLRTEHGLTYATFGGAAVYEQSWAYMYVSSPDPLAACSLMAGVLSDAISEPFEEEMLEGVIELQRTYDSMSGESMDSQCLMMGSGWINEGDWLAGYRFADLAAEITAEEVRAALDRWISHAGWGIIADTTAVPLSGLGAWSVRPEGRGE
jgi:zinc protease